MAEYIEREALIEKLNEVPAYFDNGDIRYGIDIATQQVIEQPTADVVEVVRCKDCKFLMFSDFYGECSNGHMCNVSPDDFCRRGIRKDGE